MRTLVFIVVALFLSAPVSAQSPDRIVAEERAKYTTAQMQDAATVVAFLRGVAARLNAAGIDGGPFGILVKTGGHNCHGYSCDIICAGNGSGQRQWDVLVDVGGASTPIWQGPLSQIAVRPCEVGANPEPQPNPPAPPVPGPDPLEELRARVTVLERQMSGVLLDTADIRAVLAAEVADIRKIIAALPSVELPLYRGSLWGIKITSRPCPECGG